MATAFSSKLFGYSAQLKLFATDLSVLEHVGQVWDHIFPDSADQASRWSPRRPVNPQLGSWTTSMSAKARSKAGG